jgi:hypothetical protein
MRKLRPDGTIEFIDEGRPYDSEPLKVDVPERPEGSIERRTDFRYLQGHGTFYRFVEEYFPDDLLTYKWGDHTSLVLYNLNTDQLDEVAIEFAGTSEIGKNYKWIRGFVDGCEGCWAIKIEYYLKKPLDSEILVYASARPLIDW